MHLPTLASASLPSDHGGEYGERELTRVGDGWTITAEGAGDQNCGVDLAKLAPPSGVGRCRETYATDVKKFSSCKCGDVSKACNACMSLLEGDVAGCVADATDP
jgi:hypothetical protein